MQPEASITNLAHVIQLAVAPVFLLSGVGALLSVMAARLGRIVDRLRILRDAIPALPEANGLELKAEHVLLTSRVRTIYWAISLCTVCALLVCAVIATLFIGSLAEVSVSGTIAVMFIVAMLALIVGLLFFLREIYLAMSSVQVNPAESPAS